MEKKELERLTKNELIYKILGMNANMGKLQHNIINKHNQIRHFRLRIRKLINGLDYLLKHPFSVDSSNKGKIHKRDIKYNLPSRLPRRMDEVIKSVTKK